MAGDGVDGLWKATENAYDVIVLDVMLPGLDGYQVARRLREAGRRTPILMLTAMDDDLDHAEGLDSGADDYLPKPFSYPVLLAHLRSLTRRTLGTRPAVLSAACLVLDPAGRTATRDGVPLDLTSREAAVLEHLLRHKGHVVSKTELLEHCWDVNFDGEPAVVEVLMHRLRRKLERPGLPLAIQTVRGEGYLAALLADLRAATPAPGISIDLAVPPGTTTTGNPEDLSRMFRNLLDNAVRYARHRVLVTVRITGAARPDGVVVEIADDGPGIPAGERERVFGRFVRLDASREQASGSAGLGLAIAREIATAHGATIVLTEAPGGGTRAVVTVGSTEGAATETTIRSA